MKTKTLEIVVVLILCIVFLFNATSCFVLVKKENGKHQGWYKNPNNPHNPNSTNPGKSKGNQHK
jgi:hypothetical protein